MRDARLMCKVYQEHEQFQLLSKRPGLFQAFFGATYFVGCRCSCSRCCCLFVDAAVVVPHRLFLLPLFIFFFFLLPIRFPLTFFIPYLFLISSRFAEVSILRCLMKQLHGGKDLKTDV